MEKDIHMLNWLIEADETVTKQIVEVSSDGRNFNELNQANSITRTYSYKPSETKPFRYRVHVIFENNKEYYSNAITILQTAATKPQLIGNTISGNSISVKSQNTYHYQILDQKGRMLKNGTVSKGFSSIETGNVAMGLYIIRFSNEVEQWTEKFIKK